MWDLVRPLFILFYFILFYFILFYFILFYFILFYFILFYFILFHFVNLFHFFFLEWGLRTSESQGPLFYVKQTYQGFFWPAEIFLGRV